MVTISHADPVLDVKIYQDDASVFYCDLNLRKDVEHIYKTLQQGTSIRFSWNLSIEKHYKYWWNSKFATIQIRRQVVPDLLSRGWALIDQANGISQRVTNIDQAVQFLISFSHVPIVDQSLLDKDASYLLNVELQSYEGSAEENVDSWFYSPQNIASVEFVLQ